MASIVWKGYITFGLISIPVRLYAAARGEHVSFHQLHKVCNTRIKQRLYCPTCKRDVDRPEIVKGYEFEKNRYVLVEPEEIRKVAPASGDVMEILQFSKTDEVDPLYFEASYFAVPETPGRKAYQLLVRTLEDAGYLGLAKISMHQREYTVAIRSRANGLTLHTLFYANEVRALSEYGETGSADVRPQEQGMAQKQVEALAKPLVIGQFHEE